MAKNLPIQNLVKIWTRQDVHSLVGEMMEKAREHKDQVKWNYSEFLSIIRFF